MKNGDIARITEKFEVLDVPNETNALTGVYRNTYFYLVLADKLFYKPDNNLVKPYTGVNTSSSYSESLICEYAVLLSN